MKNFLRLFLLLAAVTAAHAANRASSSYTVQTITVPGSAYDVSFQVNWFCDDFPQISAPGQVQLFNSSGQRIAEVAASVYSDGPAYTTTGQSSVSDLNWWVAVYTTGGEVADGELSATWHLTGLAPGTYTLRFWRYTSWDSQYLATTVWTTTSFLSGSVPAPTNTAPTISWTSNPGNAGSGQGYTISAHAHDAEGNLTQVNVWKNGQPFAFAGGGNGTDGDSGNPTSDTGPQTVTFTAQAVDADGATSPTITHVVTINAPVNNPPNVTLVSPGPQTVTAGTALTISSYATDPDGKITNHNLDIQRPAGDWNFQGGFATGEPFQGGPVGSGADSTRSASFTFSDVGTYYVRSAANDGSGWYHSSTVAINVVAPPPVQYALVTSAGVGGTVSPGGNYNAGTVVAVTATPDGTHDFAGWSGDAAGTANPVAVLLDRSKTVQANFSPKIFALTTSATTGGGVTPGGTYPYGTSVTVSATPDASHRFVGWVGDASGSASNILLTLTGPLNVQAVFTAKTAQTITFAMPASVPTNPAAYPLTATASSGLPVAYSVVSGPATVTGSQLTISGPGPVTLRADQPGDGLFLPAPAIVRTFNTVAAALLKYRLVGRTVLHDAQGGGTQPIVLQLP